MLDRLHGAVADTPMLPPGCSCTAHSLTRLRCRQDAAAQRTRWLAFAATGMQLHSTLADSPLLPPGCSCTAHLPTRLRCRQDAAAQHTCWLACGAACGCGCRLCLGRCHGHNAADPGRRERGKGL